MKRKIKFRAWDKKGNRMVYPDTIYTNGGCRYVESHYQGEQEPLSSEETLAPDECTLMEYTGLEDKNGKEIWEGDIVMARLMKNDNGTINSSVGFSKGCFTINGYPINTYDEYEVIGNIYQNPELLKLI